MAACLLCCVSLAATHSAGANELAAVTHTPWRSTYPLTSRELLLGYESAVPDDDPVHAAAYAWRGVARTEPDWRGARRDTAYFVGYQFAVIALLYAAPEGVSGWSDEQKSDFSFSKWRENVRRPVWDNDAWWVNYILHPYWGGAYYVRGRERGLDRAQSFWFSALLSTLFEYGAEALFEPVSAQDLVVTPVVGALVGEYLFAPLQHHIRSKPGKLTGWDKTLLTIIDPLGVVGAATDRLLGVETTLQWQPIGQRYHMLSAGTDIFGATPHAPLPERSAPTWGLQLHVRW